MSMGICKLAVSYLTDQSEYDLQMSNQNGRI